MFVKENPYAMKGWKFLRAESLTIEKMRDRITRNISFCSILDGCGGGIMDRNEEGLMDNDGRNEAKTFCRDEGVYELGAGADLVLRTHLFAGVC